MRNIKLYANLSFNGLVSHETASWVKLHDNFREQKEIDKDFQKFYDSTDAVLMSEESFESIIYTEPEWLFQFKESYIISKEMSKEKRVYPNIHFVYDDFLEEIKALKASEGGDIWIVGGEELTAALFDNMMIDEITILLLPEVIKDGVVPPFRIERESTCQILFADLLDNDIFKAVYRITEVK